MIPIKGKRALTLMKDAGRRLAELFVDLSTIIRPGISTLEIDQWVESELARRRLVSQSKGYRGYRHVSCISINDVLVHGIPSARVMVREGDLVKVDICAAWKGYCADSARCFLMEAANEGAKDLVNAAEFALNQGIGAALAGGHLYDISAVIQQTVESRGFGVVRDFCGHGIGHKMHEEPEIPNFGKAGTGPVLKSGMAFALEPMITAGKYHVAVEADGWTVRTVDGSLAAHIEDTVIITDNGPEVITR